MEQEQQGQERERGAAAVEFALVLPLLLLLVFGIVEFGRGYNAKVSLTAAVREGARVLALDDGDYVAATKAAAPSLDADAITVTASADPCTAGDPVTVTASYPFSYTVPLFSSGTITIKTEGVMRCGG